MISSAEFERNYKRYDGTDILLTVDKFTKDSVTVLLCHNGIAYTDVKQYIKIVLGYYPIACNLAVLSDVAEVMQKIYGKMIMNYIVTVLVA